MLSKPSRLTAHCWDLTLTHSRTESENTGTAESSQNKALSMTVLCKRNCDKNSIDVNSFHPHEIGPICPCNRWTKQGPKASMDRATSESRQSDSGDHAFYLFPHNFSSIHGEMGSQTPLTTKLCSYSSPLYISPFYTFAYNRHTFSSANNNNNDIFKYFYLLHNF